MLYFRVCATAASAHGFQLTHALQCFNIETTDKKCVLKTNESTKAKENEKNKKDEKLLVPSGRKGENKSKKNKMKENKEK